MNIEQYEKGQKLINAITSNNKAIRNISYFKEHPHVFYNDRGNNRFRGSDLLYLSDEELMDVINLIEKYLLAANQRLIDEFSEL